MLLFHQPHRNTRETHKLVTNMQSKCIKTKRSGSGVHPSISLVNFIKRNTHTYAESWKERLTIRHLKIYNRVWNKYGCSYFGTIGLIDLRFFLLKSYTNMPTQCKLCFFSFSYPCLCFNSDSQPLCPIPFCDLLLLLLLVDRLKKTPKPESDKANTGLRQRIAARALMWLDWKCCVYSHQS